MIFKLEEKNGICIKAFYGDIVSDRNTQKILGKILERIRFDADENGDIRKSLEKQKNIILIILLIILINLIIFIYLFF